jgi:predicted NAD/FAD-dependent oxidoreductase
MTTAILLVAIVALILAASLASAHRWRKARPAGPFLPKQLRGLRHSPPAVTYCGGDSVSAVAGRPHGAALR